VYIRTRVSLTKFEKFKEKKEEFKSKAGGLTEESREKYDLELKAFMETQEAAHTTFKERKYEA
jgi:hypothetical protein